MSGLSSSYAEREDGREDDCETPREYELPYKLAGGQGGYHMSPAAENGLWLQVILEALT